MKKLCDFIALAIVALSALFFIFSAKDVPYNETFFSMDTVMSISLFGKDGEEALKECKNEVERLDKKLSRTENGSDVYKINESSDEDVNIDEEMAHILEICQKCSSFTQGNFDITTAKLSDMWGFTKDEFKVPSDEEIEKALSQTGTSKLKVSPRSLKKNIETSIDLGGAAKGYALERLLHICRSSGIKYGLINLGGDILAIGKEDRFFPWEIYLQDPFNDGNEDISLGTLRISDSYILTSGDYQRYFVSEGKHYQHIIDPFTGRPSESGISSATVISPLSEDAGIISDALATALVIMGKEKAVDFWRSSPFKFDMILVTSDREVIITKGAESKFSPSKKDKYSYTVIK